MTKRILSICFALVLLFGVLAGGIGVGLLPVYLLVLAVALAAMHERLLRVKPAA